MSRTILMAIALLLASNASALDYPTGNTLTMEQVESRWGRKAFDAETFKFGMAKKRAGMVVSLFQSKRFLGQSFATVYRALGPSTGFYGSDHVPAYSIEEGWTMGRPTWQLVFLGDQNQRVVKIVVQEQGSDVRELRNQGWIERALSLGKKMIEKESRSTP